MIRVKFVPSADPHSLDVERVKLEAPRATSKIERSGSVAHRVAMIQWHLDREPRLVVSAPTEFTLGELREIIARLNQEAERRNTNTSLVNEP